MNYICYALRPNKHIRVLNMKNASRNLLRGYSERITDMEFFAEDVHILASARSDGRVIVRRIEEGPGEDDKLQITDYILLAIQFSGNWESVHPRICWHTHSKDLLLVGIDKYVINVDIERVRKTFAPNGFAIDNPVICPVDRAVGVSCAIEHESEITNISFSRQGRMLFASASEDGTVRLWTVDNILYPYCCLSAHSGLPVRAVAFLHSPHSADHVVLLTVGPLNRELKLWVPQGEEGWLPSSGYINWKCIQTLEFKDSLGAEPEDAFFNQVLVISKAALILLANAKKNALYAIHVDYGSNPSSTRMNYLAKFSVTMPILSLTATTDSAYKEDGILHLYCVQTGAIQQLSPNLPLCTPPMEASCFDLETGSILKNIMDTQASSTTQEVNTMLRIESSGPISGISLTEKSLGAESLPADASIDITELNEIEIKERVPIIRTGFVATITDRSPELSVAAVEQDYVCKFEHAAGEIKFDHSDACVPSSLSPKTLKDENRRPCEGTDWQVISASSAPSSISERHLVTPFELMSMAARSKGESGENKLSSTQDDSIKSKQLSESVSNLENCIEKVDLETEATETKEMTDSYADDTAQDSNTVDVIDLRKEENAVEPALFEASKQSEENTKEEQLSIQAMLDELCDELEEFSFKLEETSILTPSLALETSKKKNKNKTDGNIPVFMTSPYLEMAEISVSDGSMIGNTLPSTVVAQINSLQDSFNQLLIMQGEFQKQIGSLVGVTVVGEVKRMEVALGQHMEKNFRLHLNEMMDHLQEANAKCQNFSIGQITSLLSNSLNKEFPKAFERSATNCSQIGSSLAEFVTPNIEKAIFNAVNEAFQKGIAEKAVSELEKSIGGNVEHTLAQQIQTQFQIYLKQSLQLNVLVKKSLNKWMQHCGMACLSINHKQYNQLSLLMVFLQL